MLKIIVLLSVHRDSGFQPNVIRTLDIPMAKESVEVLEFIGFMPGAARLIYDRYLNRPNPDQNPDDRIAMLLKSTIARSPAPHGHGLKWPYLWLFPAAHVPSAALIEYY
ncbi:hypothetical protein MAP00_006259 [Monascus purpureus]|nr:hypothetical protein MAP00_006259 [Monascus purpureus]